jgi:hypothetical protein
MMIELNPVVPPVLIGTDGTTSNVRCGTLLLWGVFLCSWVLLMFPIVLLFSMNQEPNV